MINKTEFDYLWWCSSEMSEKAQNTNKQSDSAVLKQKKDAQKSGTLLKRKYVAEN